MIGPSLKMENGVSSCGGRLVMPIISRFCGYFTSGRSPFSNGRVTVSSANALNEPHPVASAAYATSKAALAALTREMANDLGRYGVRVNAVSPGEIDTAILSPGTEEIVQREIPMRRLGKPNEVADLLFFLCSNQALYLSGSEVHIDGGQRV